VYHAALGESLIPALAHEEVDVVIHCANHTGPDEFAINVDGTRRWFEDASAHGASLQILMSSLSARADAATDYGRAKFTLDQLFVAEEAVAFRLGVVIGNGGMFERITRSLARLPLVPLLDNGRGRIYFLGIDYLGNVIQDCIRSNGEGLRGTVWRLQQPNPCTLRELMTTIRSHYGFSCRFVPIPSLPIQWALSLGERLPLKLPISSTNVKGLRQSRFDEFESDFAHFGYAAVTLDDLVASAAGPRRPPEEVAGRDR
jgi:NADH dehydrogenase